MVLALPGALTAYFGFNGGGFFPAQPAVGAVFLALVLVVRVTMAEQPFAGVGAGVGLAAGALSLYALWTLASSSWSHATGRALIEFDRALMYSLALILFGSIAQTAERVRWILRGLAVGILIVCLAGLLTRLLPHVWPISPNIESSRLSYPVTYWNTLGLLAGLGIILCLHLSSSRAEARGIRVIAAGMLPLLALTLYFTFSRGAMAVTVVGVLGYLGLARSRTSLLVVLAAIPTTVVALVVAYRATELATLHPADRLAVAQGHRVAIVAALAALFAALLRQGLTRLEPGLLALKLPPRARRPSWSLLGVAMAALIALALAVQLPRALAHEYDRFISGRSPTVHRDLRERLGDVGNSGRTPEWKAALVAFRSSPWHGQGGGTYQLAWERSRPANAHIKDGHSLYFEVLGELGIVGFALLLSCLFLFRGGALLQRRRHKGLSAVIFAMILTWALRAGIDWDWEMPAVSLWVFALGGAALARRPRELDDAGTAPRDTVRILVALGWLAATVTPALIGVSEGNLKHALAAFNRGDCRVSTRQAFSSLSALANQPRPYELIGYCDLEKELPRGAIAAMQAAVNRDPGNWQYRYGLAAARASAGLDPRPAAAAAYSRNPRGDLTQNIMTMYRGTSPEQWRRQGRKARRLMLASGLVARY